MQQIYDSHLCALQALCDLHMCAMQALCDWYPCAMRALCDLHLFAMQAGVNCICVPRKVFVTLLSVRLFRRSMTHIRVHVCHVGTL